MDPQKPQNDQPQTATTVPVGQGFSSAFGASQTPGQNTKTTTDDQQEVDPGQPSSVTQETPAPSFPAATSPPPETPIGQAPLSPSQPATGPVVPPLPGAMPHSKKSKPLVIAALIVFLVLIGLILLGLVFYQDYMKQLVPAEEKTMQPTATPTVAVASPSGTIKSGDAALDQQGEAIDESLQQVEQDVSNADTSASDSPDNLQ